MSYNLWRGAFWKSAGFLCCFLFYYTRLCLKLNKTYETLWKIYSLETLLHLGTSRAFNPAPTPTRSVGEDIFWTTRFHTRQITEVTVRSVNTASILRQVTHFWLITKLNFPLPSLLSKETIWIVKRHRRILKVSSSHLLCHSFISKANFFLPP